MEAATIISYVTRKGGSGKSTLAMITATMMAHRLSGSKILLVDSDPQKSIIAQMEYEGKAAFDVKFFNWNRKDPEKLFKEFIVENESKYTHILIDTAGKMEGKEIIFSVFYADVVCIPVVATNLDIRSMLSFLKSVQPAIEKKKKQGFETLLVGVPNKLKRRKEEEDLLKVNGRDGLLLMQNGLSDKVRYIRDVSLNSQIVSTTKHDDELNLYFNEFITLINSIDG